MGRWWLCPLTHGHLNSNARAGGDEWTPGSGLPQEHLKIQCSHDRKVSSRTMARGAPSTSPLTQMLEDLMRRKKRGVSCDEPVFRPQIKPAPDICFVGMEDEGARHQDFSQGPYVPNHTKNLFSYGDQLISHCLSHTKRMQSNGRFAKDEQGPMGRICWSITTHQGLSLNSLSKNL